MEPTAYFPVIGETVKILKGEFTGYTGEIVSEDESEESCFTIYLKHTPAIRRYTPYEIEKAA